ncbi:A24 family peptidase [Pseudobutyrivibrio xylanivorans]|uniref:A24 family peptidase n=1 Tax=Pseudobutyrivibrio xylanivorans TaxID=185007 RepID=UPI0021D59188|nr:A24 family peptidase [Pseudobutyrivibrio xylanivorans]
MIWSLLTVASLFDARDYRIPNQLIVLGYMAGLFLNIQQYNAIGIVYFVIKAVVPVAILILLYMWRHSLGSGDIKLFSVMATLVGVDLTTDVMITSVMLAGVTVLMLFIYERRLDLKRRLHYSFYITAAFFMLQFK